MQQRILLCSNGAFLYVITQVNILRQVFYFHWNSDSHIENNIVVTKSLLAATTHVFAPQCLLN